MALPTDDTVTSSMNIEKEEEDSCWVPLVEEQGTQRTQQQAQARASLPDSTTRSEQNTDRPPYQRESLQLVSSRLDSKIRLKQGLVDHPLDRAWRVFLQHFCREIWQLHASLQLGVLLVVIGTVLLMITWTLSFKWFHPQTIVLLVVFGVSFYYLAPPDVERKLEAFFRLLLNPDKAFELADYVDPAVMRRFFLGLLLLPTFLEFRTFGFLSEAMAESGFLTNVSVGALLGIFLAYQFKIQQATPRQCIQYGIHVLYGFALFFSLWRVDLWRLPALAGPFLLATGTLLLSNRDEEMNWLSRVLRHALRLTLRDVLASVGESVREDEMLQLAMLRWIVDYWSYQPPPSSTTSTSSSPNQAAGSSEGHSSRTDIGETQQRHVLQWEELQPMLEMTTDQMTEEVPVHQAGSFTEQSSSQQSFESSSNASRQENDSLQNLRNILQAMDVDDRARPAVMKYKHVVESFPPTRSHAVFLSIVRRCPAMLMLLFRYVSGSEFALGSTATLLPFAIMEAFRVLHWAEACQRALEESGVQRPTREQQASNRQSRASSFIYLPPEMNPMYILLSGDHFSPTFPPPLLQVWINITCSVRALQTGLTAARCVQTTVVAADFASNIISLAQFGVEVNQFGWAHGISVLARELMHIHTTQSAGEAKYTSAIVNAVRNGSIVARNVRALSEEEDGNPVLDPIGGVLAAIVGRGWLWGKQEENQQESTVTIEELPDDETATDIKVRTLLIKDSASDENQARNEDRRKTPDARADSDPLAGNSNVKEALKAAADDECHEVLSEQGQRAGELAFAAVCPAARTEPQESEAKPSSADVASDTCQEGTNRDESEQDLSELMQLIAEAFEQGLIVETEKNAFMETLLVSGNEQQDKPCQNTIEKMERSLRKLLELSQNENISMLHKGQGSEPPIILPERGDAGEPVSTCENATEHSDEVDEWRPLPSQPKLGPRQAMDEAPSSEPNDSLSESTHSAVIRPSDENSLATPTFDAHVAPTTQSSSAQQQSKGDDWMKWVGGSIAVIGAVAGGIAIANNASQRDNDNSSTRNNSVNQSTVYIEELDDDEDIDEWVAVPSSNKK